MSTTNIEVSIPVDPNPGVPTHPGRVSGKPEPGTDWSKTPGRWAGPNTDIRGRKTLSSEALAELHDAARSKKRPLTEAERVVILQKFS